ncbi:hypothetical protein MKEN_00349400 [Mycena kentingensis (nom. inval.)]|nr:hypothetical protein MKEN_00349400 [Mycena kentingensis (nom. inval.)]
MTWITLKSVVRRGLHRHGHHVADPVFQFYRITLTRFTIAFFLFSFIHAFAEGFIQAFIFSQDSTASNTVSTILHQAQVPSNYFGILERPRDGNATLTVCSRLDLDLPKEQRPCGLVYETNHPNLPFPSEHNLTSHLFAEGITVSPTGVAGAVDVVLDNKKTAKLSQMCTLVMTYPHQVLMNAQREDIALVVSQFWIFAISFFGIVYDSIPHLIAALCFRFLCTGWSIYIVWRTGDIRKRFEMLLASDDSPCKPLQVDELFPGYFASREALQIPDLTLNIVALVLSVYLSTKLIKVYGVNTFNRVGAPPAIIRIYKYFLAVFVSFQISGLMLISAVSLWLDQMVNRDNAMSSDNFTYHRSLYLALSIFTLAILVPWITTGWYAVRREWKKLMVAFLAAATLVFTSWVLMLKSWSFAFTFVNWPFFAIQIVAASISLVSTIGFGIVSYLHFDKGLAHYLYVDNELAKAGFEPELFEKDVEKVPQDDWRDIGLDDIPTYTLQFSTSSSTDKDQK